MPTIVQQSTILQSITPDAELLIEQAGRCCYKSEGKTCSGSAAKMIAMLLKRGHESVLEHASATIMITTDRGITHEMVRHRLASYCMSGDTVVPAFGATLSSPVKSWTMRQLYEWSLDPARKGRLRLIRLRSVDENNRLVPGIIKSVVFSGRKAVLCLTTESGRAIVATSEHKVLTPDGWRTCGELGVGSFLMANGKFAVQSKEWIIEQYVTKRLSRPEVAKLAGVSDALMGKWIRMHGIEKSLSLRKNRKPGHGVKGMHGVDGRKAISERMSGEGNHRWAGDNVGSSGGRLRAGKLYDAGPCTGCGETKDTERHHIDENTTNNTPANIRILCPKCHKAWHHGQGVRVVFRDRINKIEPAGAVDTYDIEMQGPNHNFVADGIVVHNSQESTWYVDYIIKEDGEAEESTNINIKVVPPIGLNADQMDVWSLAVTQAEERYEDLRRIGCPPQVARDVLPTCLKADIWMTCNFREWRHFIKLRASKAAHPKIRVIANAILVSLNKHAPNVFPLDMVVL